ncbi:MAG: hypothetical protein WGN25_01100 [Candidatus Electrothrix sp. GW3-4]|uniref:hypothetical protein n=1 Tax=Candidatus Electrothrix sp. GW3-4 TaxID=3126740 RepID=UPI0030D030C5
MEEKSKIESVAGSLSTTLVTTGIGVLSGGIASFLPLLTGTLAHGRHVKRIEAAIKDLEESINKQGLRINELTDAQYKIIGDAINCMLSTVDEEKIEYLKRAIRNSFKPETASELEYEAEVLTRTLRDISAKEAKFIVERTHKEETFTDIRIFTEEKQPKPSPSKVSSDGKRHMLTASTVISAPEPYCSLVTRSSLYVYRDEKMKDKINRLLSLNLLRKVETNEKEEIYNFTPIADQIKTLLTEDKDNKD